MPVNDIRLLGSVAGGCSLMSRPFRKRLAALEATLEALQSLDDPQVPRLLFRACVVFPAVTL